MKKPLLYIIPFIILGIAGCKKGDNLSANVSEADIANMIGGSLSGNSYGLASLSPDVSVTAQTFITGNTVCGSTKLDSISRQSAPGAETIFGFKAKHTNKLFCNSSNVPDNVTNTLTYSGYINSPRIFVTNTGSSSFVIAGLVTNSPAYVVNGTYQSTGTFKMKADTTNNGTVNINLVITNLVITKATPIITSGGATATITGNVPKKGTFTANGAITFNGSGVATLTINANVYKINLVTGIVTKQ